MQATSRRLHARCFATVILLGLSSPWTAAYAEDAGSPQSGHLEAGITGNVDDPPNQRNFGRLFDDHSNRPVLNQFMLTAERPLDPKATGWDFGFKTQIMYGSDARFTHLFNQLDRVIHDTNQFDIVEAYGSLHVPGIGEGGMDLKLGQFASPMSAESIDAL